MSKKKYTKRYMRAPQTVKHLKSEVMERNNNQCCNCHKQLTPHDAVLYLKNPHRKNVELTADKMKVLCKKCSTKMGIPYVDPNKEQTSKQHKEYRNLKNDSLVITTAQIRRRSFTDEERKQILKNTYGICACCGKKLNLSTMTVEHIIPLDEEGTNDIENLTALCKQCNSIKSNDLYLAEGFYSALINKPRYREIANYVNKWFVKNRNKLNLVKNPMIGPHFNVFHVPFNLWHNKKTFTYTTQFMYQYSFVPSYKYSDINKLTGMNTDDIAKKMNERNKTKNKPVAFYTCKKISTGKIFMVIAIMYDPENYRLTYYIPWSDVPNPRTNSVFVEYVIRTVICILTNIAHEPIDEFIVEHHDTDAMHWVVDTLSTSGLATGCKILDNVPGTDIPIAIKAYRYDPTSKNETATKPSQKQKE